MIGVALSWCASAVAAVRGCRDGRIAFDSLRDGSRDIYVLNPFASGSGPPAPDPRPVRLTTGSDDEKPSWSPPAVNLTKPCQDPTNPPRMVAFQRTINGSTNIYAIDAATPEQGGQAVQVTNGGADTAPAWAPFTPKGAPQLTYPPIAFVRNIGGRRDIFVANSDGSDETNLTNTLGVDESNPDWATGGGAAGVPEPTLSLAFDSDQGGIRELWVMTVGYNANNPPGQRFVNRGMREVTAGQPVSANPSWFVFTYNSSSNSALMDNLAFAGPDQDGAPSQIDVAQATVFRASADPPFSDPANTDFAALTSDASDNSAPAWSPLGDYIAYQKTAADGRSDVYVLNPTSDDPTTDINLTQQVGDNRNPDWEAVGLQMADVFPIRPLGRRQHKRAPRSIVAQQQPGPPLAPGPPPGTVPPPAPVPRGPTPPTPPAFAARLRTVAPRGHGRSRVVVIGCQVNAAAVVTVELRKGHRRVAFHRWRVSGGARLLRLQVPRGTRGGTYEIRVIVRAISGPTQRFSRSVHVGP